MTTPELASATAAVVVAWRRATLTRETIESLLVMSPTVDTICCVVQEWSFEEISELEEMLPPTGFVIAHDENLGYAPCANEGVNAAVARGAAHVLIVNNDATVTKDCLERVLLAASQVPRLAAVGPAVVFTDEPDRIWYAGGRQSHLLAFTTHPRLRESVRSLPPSGPTQYIPGCCVLVSADAWQEIGPYRDDYFLYYEDVEWCARARANGWTCWYLGEVLCQHAVSASAGERGSIALTDTGAYYLARNPLRFALETQPPPLRASRVFGVLAVWGLYNASRLARSRSLAAVKAYWEGTRDALAGHMGPRHPRAPERAPRPTS